MKMAFAIDYSSSGQFFKVNSCSIVFSPLVTGRLSSSKTPIQNHWTVLEQLQSIKPEGVQSGPPLLAALHWLLAAMHTKTSSQHPGHWKITASRRRLLKHTASGRLNWSIVAFPGFSTKLYRETAVQNPVVRYIIQKHEAESVTWWKFPGEKVVKTCPSQLSKVYDALARFYYALTRFYYALTKPSHDIFFLF